MLKEYSLLNYKQLIILLNDYRKRALKFDNHNTSRHLLHIKRYLKMFHPDNYISYHEASKFLVSPYLYDDGYNKQVLICNFNLNKHNATQNALKIIKSVMKFEPTNHGVKIDDKVLKAHNQQVYTPKITKNYLKHHLLIDNQNAKLLFKKFYHNNFKKANQGSENIGSPFYSTVKNNITHLKKNITTYQKDIKSLNKIITVIEDVVKANPKLRDINELYLDDEAPLSTYKSCLKDTNRELKDSKSSLQDYQKMDGNILLCNGRVATPNDIERDIHRYDSSQKPLSYSDLAEKDLASLKN